MSPESNFNRSEEAEEERRRRRLERLRRLKEKLRENREAGSSFQKSESETRTERSSEQESKPKSTIRRMGERAWRAVFPKTESQSAAKNPEYSQEETKLNRLKRFGRKVTRLITGVNRDVENAVGEDDVAKLKTETASLDQAKESLRRATTYNEEVSKSVASEKTNRTKESIAKERNLDVKIESNPNIKNRSNMSSENNSTSAEGKTKVESGYDPDYDPNLAFESSFNLRRESTAVGNSKEAVAAQLAVEKKQREAAEQHANNLGLVATVGVGAAVYKTIQSHQRKKAVENLESKQSEDLKTIKTQKNELSLKEAELNKLKNQKPDFNNDEQRHEYVERVAVFGQEAAQVITTETGQVEQEINVPSSAKKLERKAPNSTETIKPIVSKSEITSSEAPAILSKETEPILKEPNPNKVGYQGESLLNQEKSHVKDDQEKTVPNPAKTETATVKGNKETVRSIIETSQQTVEGIEQIDNLDQIDGVLTEKGYSKQIEARDRDDLISNGSGYGGKAALDEPYSGSNLSVTDKQKAQQEAKKKAKLALQKKTAKNGVFTILIVVVLAAGAAILF